MKKGFFSILLFIPFLLQAQQLKFDIVSYTAPQGWQKEEKSSYISYMTVTKSTGGWCQLTLYKSANSKGSVQQDFSTDWQELVAPSRNITAAPQMGQEQEADGWKVLNGHATYKFNNGDAAALLTTISGFSKRVSILVCTNSQEYATTVDNFISSIELKKPTAGSTTAASTPKLSATASASGTAKTNNASPADNAPKGPYKFTTTNFDDGWVSTPKEDWVEVTKGNMRVLLHYGNPDRSSMDYKTISKNAWNQFIAPRYGNMKDQFMLSNNISYEAGYFSSATLTDNASGQTAYVVLFQKGRGPWTEFIVPDKATFIQQFGIDKMDIYFSDWDPLVKMSGYNRFAVAPSDLTGKWTSNYSGYLQYVNTYTGLSAGASAHSSVQYYNFKAGNTYDWEIKVASGMVGNQQFKSAKSSGKLSMPDNWQLACSNMEGKPKTYPVYFSCTKDGRILWIDGTAYVRNDK